MNKKMKLLNNKIKLKKMIEPQQLKYLCGFESDFEVLDGLLIILNDEINKIESSSTRKECRYIYLIVEYINKMINLTYISDTTTIIKKAEKQLIKIDQLLDEVNNNMDLEKFLLTLQSKINKVIININKNQKQYGKIEQQKSKDLLFYALFERQNYNISHDLL